MINQFSNINFKMRRRNAGFLIILILLIGIYMSIKYGTDIVFCDDIIIETKTRKVISEEDYKVQQQIAINNAFFAALFKLYIYIQFFPL